MSASTYIIYVDYNKQNECSYICLPDSDCPNRIFELLGSFAGNSRMKTRNEK